MTDLPLIQEVILHQLPINVAQIRQVHRQRLPDAGVSKQESCDHRDAIGLIFDRCDVQGGRTGHRFGVSDPVGKAVVRDRVTERHRRVIIERRGVCPSAVVVVDKAPQTRRDGQSTGYQRVIFNIFGVGQQLRLGNDSSTTVLGNRCQSHCTGRRHIIHSRDRDSHRIRIG